MPKVRKRKTAGGALDPFAPAPADGTEGAMMRFHRLQQRELRKKIQDLEMERSRIAKKDGDRSQERKSLTTQVRELQARFDAKCKAELKAMTAPASGSSSSPAPAVPAPDSGAAAARAAGASTAWFPARPSGEASEPIAALESMTPAVRAAAAAAEESQRVAAGTAGISAKHKRSPMMVLGDSRPPEAPAAAAGAAGEWAAVKAPEGGAAVAKAASSSSSSSAAAADDQGEVLSRAA